MPRNNRNNLIADSKRKIGTKHVGLGNHSNNRIVSSPLFGSQNLSKMMMTMEKFTLSVFSSVFGYNSKIIVSVKAFSTHSAVSSQHTSIFFSLFFSFPHILALFGFVLLLHSVKWLLCCQNGLSLASNSAFKAQNETRQVDFSFASFSRSISLSLSLSASDFCLFSVVLLSSSDTIYFK